MFACLVGLHSEDSPLDSVDRPLPAPAAPLRVLVAISNLEYGGAQRQMIELVNSADPASAEMHLCSLSDVVPLAAQLREPSRLHVVPRRSKFDASVVGRLNALVRSLRIDVLQGVLFDAEIATRVSGRMTGAAVVGAERSSEYVLGRVPRIAYRLTRGWVDLIIANSRAGAAFNGRYLGHPPDLYRVVYNGVDTGRFRPMPRGHLRAELGLDDTTPLVGMVASLKAVKNHPLLLRAARRLRERGSSARFVFVGDQMAGGLYGSDAYAKQVHELVDSLGLRDACIFLGNRHDLPELYSDFDVTVLPSLLEGTPNVLLESMACGCPVIATDVSDNARVAPPGRVGEIVPSDDDAALAAALERVLGDRQLRDRYAGDGRAWVLQEFSTAAMARRTIDVYREALARRRSR